MNDRLQVPALLQVSGRMHPLVLHFPIVLLLLYAVYALFFQGIRRTEAEAVSPDWLLLTGAFTAALAALMGLFLSQEEGYDPETIAWHKYGGAVVSFLAIGWYFARGWLNTKTIPRIAAALLMAASLLITGHAGADITHGEGFLLAPIQTESEKPTVAVADARIYEDIVAPILESKCLQCHSAQKSKGDLRMDTREWLLKGGKSGKLWDHENAGSGILLERIWLPLEAKEHMPPTGKAQLSETEKEILQRWIAAGAPFNKMLTELPAGDSLYQLAVAQLGNGDNDINYDFAAASSSTIQALNTENRVVTEIAMESPALQAQFFNSSQFQPSQLVELKKVAEQIVSLDLARMPLSAKDIETIGAFPNLEKLNLSFTPVEGSWLQPLANLKKLRSLSLSGTAVKPGDFKALQDLTSLQQLYVWQTPGNSNEWKTIQQAHPQLLVETGFSGDSIILKLSAPVLENEVSILTGPTLLKLKHYIKGAEIRYTLDGTEPDSVHAPLYKGNEMVEGNVLVRAKAFKPGWYSSDIMEASLYSRSVAPDSILLETEPDPSYSGSSSLLTNLVKGETNFRDGNWLAWRGQPMKALIRLSKPTTVSSVAIGGLVDIGSYIMPPLKMEVWGGDEPGQLKKLGSLQPQQPDKMGSLYLRGFECKFPPTSVKYLRLLVQPVMQLPSWHPGRGDKAWVFVDEILIN